MKMFVKNRRIRLTDGGSGADDFVHIIRSERGAHFTIRCEGTKKFSVGLMISDGAPDQKLCPKCFGVS